MDCQCFTLVLPVPFSPQTRRYLLPSYLGYENGCKIAASLSSLLLRIWTLCASLFVCPAFRISATLSAAHASLLPRHRICSSPLMNPEICLKCASSSRLRNRFAAGAMRLDARRLLVLARQ